MEVVHGPARDRPRRRRSCTPTRTRCSATPRSGLANNIAIALDDRARGRGAALAVTVGGRRQGSVPLPRARACWASCSRRTRRSHCTSGAATTRPRSSASSSWCRGRVRGRVPARSADGVRTARSRSRSAVTVVRARARPPRRRAPRAQHRVRVLGDRRHPRRRPGQHHVLAADRGGAAARRARGVATARSAHRVRGDRHARGHAARDGGAALRRRLRRRHRRRPRLRALRVAAARPHDPSPHRRDPRRRCSWSRACSSASPTSCARATSRPTSAASSTSCVNGAPGDSFLTIRRKLDANLDVVRRHQAAVGPARSSRCSPWYLWRVRGGTHPPAVPLGAGDPPDRARARGRRGRSATRSTTPASRSRR